MKKTIIILHGWGSAMSGKRYEGLKNLIEKKGYTVFTPDLPGFGENPLTKEVLEFDDYVQFVKTFIEKSLHHTKQKKIVLLGHSFGGRIAIRVAKLYPALIDSLVLTGASGIPRPLPSLKKKLVYALTKATRPVFSIPPFSFFYAFFRKAVYYSIGEMDYYKAASLRETFKNVYQVSILPDLPEISVPTLIVWGENDTFTPLADGQLMHEKIQNSKLVVIPDATHKLPYENPEIFAKQLSEFIS